MRIVDCTQERQEVPVLDLEDMQVFEGGRVVYTQTGVERFGQLFRRHGFDIRTVEGIEEHEQTLWECASNDLMQALINPPEEAVRQRCIHNHLRRFVTLTRRERFALARIHEDAIYELEGLTQSSAKELYFLCHIFPALEGDTV